MTTRRAVPADGRTLVDVWLRSVRATHAFLSEADIQALLPGAERYLTASGAALWEWMEARSPRCFSLRSSIAAAVAGVSSSTREPSAESSRSP